eukprot:TRINITY_DN2512_c0_g1_i2.p1 TRINITY_DN2512_c0_g1~~TRINITY_DN2512_c0_g1_i2.p1  ORF type:complete len:508 (+),score=141.86 TRINITY_DN2512_c0_g1_i2:143-1525(+)
MCIRDSINAEYGGPSNTTMSGQPSPDEIMQLVVEGRKKVEVLTAAGKDEEAAQLTEKLDKLAAVAIQASQNSMVPAGDAAAGEDDDDDDGVFSWFSQLQMDSIEIDEDGPVHPLFMDPEDLKDPKNAATLEWLSSLQYDGKDSLEIAQELKEKGNNALVGKAMQVGGASGHPNPKMAIEIYDDALAQKCGDVMLESVLWANRAAAQMKLKNWRHVMHDCVKAIRLNKAGIKPYWRGAQAALKLKRYKECIEFCVQGLLVESDNKELLGIQKKAETGAAQLQAEEDQRVKKQKRMERAAKMLHAAVKHRGVRLGVRPEWLVNTYHLDLRGTQEVYVDEDECLHWAVAFLYPEHAQSDLVQDMHEECTVGEQLSQMFPPMWQQPSWDTEAKYQTPQLLVCYERSPSADGKKPKSRFGIVSLETTLKDAVALPDCVVPGFPTFHVVVEGSAFAKQYLDDSYVY